MAVKKKVVEIDTSQATTSVKDLRTLLKALKDTMASTEAGTEEYNKALRQAAEILHQLREQMRLINNSAADFGQIVSNSTSVLGGMIAGFQSAKAVMSMFGVENENVIKSLQTMQNLMALTQALPALDKAYKGFVNLTTVIKTATGATNGFKAALVSTGLGAIITALGLLVTNWDKVSDAMRRWGILNEDTKKKLEDLKKKVEELRGELAKLEGSYDEWERNNKISKLNAKAKKSYDNLSESITRYLKQLDIIVAKQQQPENQSRERWESLNKEGLALLENIKQLKNQQDAILANADSYKQLTTAIKDTKTATNELEIELWNSTQMLLGSKSLQEELLAKLGGMPITLPVKLGFGDEEEEDSDTSFEDAFRLKIEGTIQGLRGAFKTPEEQYAEEINALDCALQTKLIKEEEYNKLRDALNKEQTQNEISRYAAAAGAIGNIFSSLGDLMEEGSEEQKAFQIMGATINMLGGITSAISGAFTTHSGPWDIALAVLQATAIATSGAASIAKMAKTNKSNAKSSASAAQSSTNALASVNAPVQYTQDVQGASIEGAIKDTRVYVTESDITNTQERVNVAESEARY